MMRCKAILYFTACASALLWGNPVRAQQSTQAAAPESGGIEEIIVTARKREESLLKVPVIETAIPHAQLRETADDRSGGPADDCSRFDVGPEHPHHRHAARHTGHRVDGL